MSRHQTRIHNPKSEIRNPLSRREMLQAVGGGLGMLGLAQLLADSAKGAVNQLPGVAAKPEAAGKSPHFRPRAK